MTQPRVLILHANGTNRDWDAVQAIELAGGQADIVHINQLRNHEKNWKDYQMLVLPGGFSYADALGAGKLVALDLKIYFSNEAFEFVAAGKPVIGICNGFQTLVKSGLLPDPMLANEKAVATLTNNECGHFECRWVHLLPVSQNCIWTKGLKEMIYCPIAHGEGNFLCKDEAALQVLAKNDQIALIYASEKGKPAQQAYPDNPNGSLLDIAGICNRLETS